MSTDAEPQSKRQRTTFDPPPAREPQFYQPSAPYSSTVASSSSSDRRGNPKSSSTLKQLGRTNIHGNFLGYYSKRRTDPTALDPRLALLPVEWIKGKRVLDVGCNSGHITVELAQQFEASRVTGVDIDEELIRLAKRHADLAWSRQAPLPHLTEAAQQQASASPERPPRHAALPDAPASSPDLHYFPVSLPRMFGYLTAPQELLTSYVEVPEIETVGVTKRGKRKVMPVEVRSFPENLRFKVADWPNEEIDLDRRGYDVIFALSVTKWIHLNSLNEGLLLFFTRCFETLLPGGRLILEPQPFSTYSKSARTSDQLKANLDKLRDGKGEERGWRSEDGDFEKILLDKIGFERKESLGETGKDGFRRPMEVYYKRGGSWL